MKEMTKTSAPLCDDDVLALRNFIASQGLGAQVSAITSDRPLTVVSAGAGTGKTWTLAWRFIWAAMTRTDSKNILTITFTEKAAAEMRSRIASLLKTLDMKMRSAGIEPSPELIERRNSALEMLDQAYISTIHGFGMRVIGEAGLALPIEPSPRLISDAEGEEFWNTLKSALDRLDTEWFCYGMGKEYSEKVTEIFADSDIYDAVNKWGPDAVTSFAKDFEGMLSDFGYSPESVLEHIDAPSEEVMEGFRCLIQKEIEDLAGSWYNNFVFDIDVKGKGKGKFVDAFISLRSKWKGQDFSRGEAAREFIVDAYDKCFKASGKLSDAVAKTMKIKITDWRKKAEEPIKFIRLLRDGWSDNELRVRRCLILLGWTAWKKWQSFKETHGGISFSDMIILAAQAVEKDPEYASRFTEILVDEFQDTNTQQDNLIKAIHLASGGRLFIVGDLKQSIYKFRHAEPSLFARYVKQSEANPDDAKYIKLVTSFRSCQAVLDAVNVRFGDERMWKDRLGEGLRVRYEALESPEVPLEHREEVDIPVERLMETFRTDPVAGKVTEKISAVRERLALRLADRLAQLRDEKRLIWDREKNCLAPIEWRDMAILVPTRSGYSALENAFRKAGVPIAFSDSRSFYSRTEIRDICSLAALLADHNDRIALGGYLCSPFSGLTQEDAQELLPLLDADDPMSVLRIKYPGIHSTLETLFLAAMFEGSAKAIGSLLEDLSFLDRVEPRKRAGVVANLRRAVLLLEEYEQSLGRSCVGSAAYLRRALKAGTNETREASAEDDENSVKVSTIHSSKGLEYPLVAVFGLEFKGNSDAGGSLAPSGGLIATASGVPDPWNSQEDETAVKAHHEKLEKENLLLDVHKRLERLADYEERQRLYYVALTRARDGLILCGTLPKKPRDDFADELSFRSIEEVAGPLSPTEEIVREAAPKEIVEDSETFESEDVTAEEVPELDRLIERPSSLSYISASSYSLWTMCRAAWRRSYRQGLELTWSPGVVESAGSVGGTEVGSIAHWLMSRWDFTEKEAERLMALRDGQLYPEYRSAWRDPKARQEIAGFFDVFLSEGMPLLARLRRAKEQGSLKREYRLSVPLSIPGYDVPVDLIGAVDVFWLETDEEGRPVRLCVRDYKTTRMPVKENRCKWTEDLYASQLKFYAFCLRRMHPEYAPLELDLAIYNLRTGAEQKIPPLALEDERMIEAELKIQAVEAVKDGRSFFIPSLHRCESCVYSDGCIFRGEGVWR